MARPRSGGRYTWTVSPFDGRRVREHVAVAERALGRRLPAGADVHHVNGIVDDNRPSNLVICQDDKFHKLLHQRTRIVRAGGDPNVQRICAYCRKLTPIELMVKQKPDDPRGPIGRACKRCVCERTKAYEAKKRQAAA